MGGKRVQKVERSKKSSPPEASEGERRQEERRLVLSRRLQDQQIAQIRYQILLGEIEQQRRLQFLLSLVASLRW